MRRWRMRRKVLLSIAAVVVGVGVFSYARFRPSLVGARARISTGSQIASTRCGPIEYAEAGAGPPVLVIHGAGGGFDQGITLGEAPARGGFRVIAPSRFGYLRTPVPADASAEAQADAHAETFMAEQTYLQHAQPSTFGHYLLSFGYSCVRDAGRLLEELDWVDCSPGGAGCVNGTRLLYDRSFVADALGSTFRPFE